MMDYEIGHFLGSMLYEGTTVRMIGLGWDLWCFFYIPRSKDNTELGVFSVH